MTYWFVCVIIVILALIYFLCFDILGKKNREIIVLSKWRNFAALFLILFFIFAACGFYLTDKKVEYYETYGTMTTGHRVSTIKDPVPVWFRSYIDALRIEVDGETKYVFVWEDDLSLNEECMLYYIPGEEEDNWWTLDIFSNHYSMICAMYVNYERCLEGEVCFEISAIVIFLFYFAVIRCVVVRDLDVGVHWEYVDEHTRNEYKQ